MYILELFLFINVPPSSVLFGEIICALSIFANWVLNSSIVMIDAEKRGEYIYTVCTCRNATDVLNPLPLFDRHTVHLL